MKMTLNLKLKVIPCVTGSHTTLENTVMYVGIQHECHFGQGKWCGGVSVMPSLRKQSGSSVNPQRLQQL